MNKVINIPNADRDERIGSVFNHLFSVIFANEQIRDNDVPVWDFSNASFPIHSFCSHLPYIKANVRTYSVKMWLDI